MNITQNVNIGGYPFILDQDAYEEVRSYLEIIEAHFSLSEGCDEIVHDIELRFAELLLSREHAGPIVTKKDIDQVMKILGTPEDFGAESITSRVGNENRDSDGIHPVPRRLFRDPENKVIAGVCSGLSTYFGINDPIWIRIAFVAVMFAGGSSVLIYLILCAVMPKAKTPLDRLAMEGKPINVQTIADQVEDSIDHITNKIDELSDKWKSKKKDKSYHATHDK